MKLHIISTNLQIHNIEFKNNFNYLHVNIHRRNPPKLLSKRLIKLKSDTYEWMRKYFSRLDWNGHFARVKNWIFSNGTYTQWRSEHLKRTVTVLIIVGEIKKKMLSIRIMCGVCGRWIDGVPHLGIHLFRTCIHKCRKSINQSTKVTRIRWNNQTDSVHLWFIRKMTRRYN